MRQIKFRAWDTIRMTTSGIIFNTTTGCVVVPEGSAMKLMQFTGLLDKNGKEIYEGDLLQLKSSPDIVYEAFWSEKHAGWKVRLFRNWGGVYVFNIHEMSYEIIGNIYENPELLK